MSCSARETVERFALEAGGETDATFVEAHLESCAECNEALERALSERELFARRAAALAEVVQLPGPEAVFTKLDRRRERFRRAGGMASVLTAVAACMAMTVTPLPGAPAPARAPERIVPDVVSAAEAEGELMTRASATSGGDVRATTSTAPGGEKAPRPRVSSSCATAILGCEPNVTCSVETP